MQRSLAHGRHHDFVATTGMPGDVRATAKAQVLTHADPYFHETSVVARNADGIARQTRVRLDESVDNVARRHNERTVDVRVIVGNVHRGPRGSHTIEICSRRQTGTRPVPIPFMKNQMRTWHEIEHVIGDHAGESWGRHLTIRRKATFVLRPKAMHDKCKPTARTLSVVGPMT